MKFELLPNEMLLDLFNYFDGVDLLRAFFGLNYRFNLLIDNQFRTYRFEFKSIFKRDFDVLCQQHLPLLADRTVALTLSDYNETPGQIQLFLTYIPSFSPFIHLQSLTIRWLRSSEILLKILDECQYLDHLTRLNFYFCHFRTNKTDFQLIINTIWNLAKLIQCNLGIDIRGQEFFCIPTVISSSLKRLSTYGSKIQLNQINDLFYYTPQLSRLSICIDSSTNENYVPSLLSTLIELNINSSYLSDVSKIVVFLQQLPNLRRLNINLISNLIDGHQWEEIIDTYLPKLRVFRLQMTKIFILERNIEERVNELIHSFRSSFWMDEHRWFVRCLVQKRTIYLHTITDRSSCLEEIPYDSWRSTHPDDDQQELTVNMTSIYNERFFEQSIPSYVHLSNIEFLSVKLPVNDRFWDMIPSFKRLYSLNVSSYTDACHSQLQTLLTRAPHLSHLTIHRDISLPWSLSLFRSISASIRRLDLKTCKHHFSVEDCITLSTSSLGIHCEVLSIIVNNRECIIRLIKRMAKLQALHVQYEEEDSHQPFALRANNDPKYYDEKTSRDDGIVQWLKYRLPSTCSISKTPDTVNDISIWIQ